MIQFKTIIRQFGKQGEKTGWTYIEIPAKLANKINPGIKTSYRVKGKLDEVPIKGQAVLPMGEGNFILTLNAALRKKIRKAKGASLEICLEQDPDKFPFNRDFLECLKEEPVAEKFFYSLSGSMQHYFSNWIDSAKTDPTRVKRIAQAVNALTQKQDFGNMLRSAKKQRDEFKRS